MTVDKILEMEAFKALGEKRLKFIKETIEKDKITPEDMCRFVYEASSWTDLSEESKGALMSAFYDSLSDDERKRINYILDIVSSFS